MENTICYGSPEDLLPEMLEYLSRGEGFWLVVTGGSMYPTLLHESDSVFIEPLTHEIRIGDILLVLTGDCHCILHLVIRVRKDAFIMQGDALAKREGPVPRQCVLGIATFRRRRGSVQLLSRHRSINVMVRRFWRNVNDLIS